MMTNHNRNVFRVLDANVNRALEGMRVLEEAARMLLDNADLTNKIKCVRHSLTGVIKEKNGLERSMLRARGSESDVLREGVTDSEKTRKDIVSLVSANASRANEAVRVLEEYIKLVHPGLSEKFKLIRFMLYDCEKDLIALLSLKDRINKSNLSLCIMLGDESPSGKNISDLAVMFIEKGASMFLFRERLFQSEDIHRIEHVVSLCRSRGVVTIIENRIDIAIMVKADGVQVKYGTFAPADCKSLAGLDCAVGVFVPFDSLSSVVVPEQTDYWCFGPVNLERSNRSDTIRRLEAFMTGIHVPVVVQGDIYTDSLEMVFECGVSGIMVEPDITDTGKILNTINLYRHTIDRFMAGSGVS